MIERLSDIEAMAMRCHSEQSKNYISEAILCYQSGAYRAAIVCTWIAVVFDLIDKIREVSLGGDSDAKKLIGQYENYISEINKGNNQGITNALQYEREILSKCRDTLKFLDQQQFIDLTRLKEDRHRCAHPSFQQSGSPYSASAEQARLHIRNAIFHVLSQPPIQGKAAITHIKAAISSDLFPSEIEKSIIQLKSVGLNNPSPSLVKSLIEKLFFDFFEVTDVIYHKTQVVVALNSIREMFPEIYEQHVRKSVNKIIINAPDSELSLVVYLLMSTQRSWELLEQSGKDKIVRFIQVSSFDLVSNVLWAFASKSELIDVVNQRIVKFDIEQLAKIINYQILKPLIKNKAFEILSSTQSWDQANNIFTKLIFPLFDLLNVNDIEKIIKMPTTHGADLRGSHGFTTFISTVKKSNIMQDFILYNLLAENGYMYLMPQK